MPRADETQYRLIAWTGDSGAAERLAAQVLLASGFQDPEPSHPYGGPDGGRDATFTLDGERWVMAVYFPHGAKPFSELKLKFSSDIKSAKKHNPTGVAFVTNQEITVGEREELRGLASGFDVQIFHMERVAATLDQPPMASIRHQFLGIDPGTVPLNLHLEVGGVGQFVVDGNELREALLSSADESDRKAAANRRATPPTQHQPLTLLTGIMRDDSPSPPSSPDEVEQSIVERRSLVEKEWGRIEDYILGLTCPAMHFTITNVAESFLYDLRVVISFAGAHGAEKLRIEDFEDEKLLDPDYERPQSIYSTPTYRNLKLRGYPVEWKNTNSGLEVRITLPELPPGEAFEWSSDNYEDVVLVAPTDQPVYITWLAVAQRHGTPFTGTDLTVPTEKVSALDAAAWLFDSVRET
jgi:hypothetical protein